MTALNSHLYKRASDKINPQNADNNTRAPPEPGIRSLPDPVFKHALHQSGGAARNQDWQTVAKGKQQYVQDAGPDLFLNGDDSQDRRDKPESASTGQNAVSQAQD